MSKRYQIGVIGTGSRATSFATQLHETMPRAQLAGLCDIDSDRLEQFVKAHDMQGAATFTDVDAMLAQKDLDAVIVTAPEFAHAEITIKALHAGKPVYLEKPVAHTLDATYDMIEAQRETGVLVYLGFNLRAAVAYIKLRDIITSGVLGQIIHIACVEQLHVNHIASFMRRFHRHSKLNGGLLNTKCSHDMDIMCWLVGREHHVTKISSFGGCDIFKSEKQPATHCHKCPADVYAACPYKAPGSDDIRRGKTQPVTSNTPDLYPGDLCVFTDDKDLVDNQTVIMQWDHGVRGSFQLQGFQHRGSRMTRIWCEHGVIDFDGQNKPHIRVTHSQHGDTDAYHFADRTGGHGGVDNLMIDRFINAIESGSPGFPGSPGSPGNSGLLEGLAATILALKADESRLTGKTIDIPVEMYTHRPT